MAAADDRTPASMAAMLRRALLIAVTFALAPLGAQATFTRGSTAEEVRRVQGLPTVVERLSSLGIELWDYGDDATVRFGTDSLRVIGWDNPHRTLKVVLQTTGRPSTARAIAIGSTRDDVVHVQGTPLALRIDRRTGVESWGYGMSVVTVDRSGHVTRLDDDGNVLRIAGATAKASTRPGGALLAGMRLVYASDRGAPAPPWVIDSVRFDVALGGRRGCTLIDLRVDPQSPTGDRRGWCEEAGTLFAWNARIGQWEAARPLVPAMTLDVPRAGGEDGRVRYEVGVRDREQIGSHIFDVVHTVVTTYDDQGRAIRRLRERFAFAIATATGGTFEVPDRAAAGAWRTEREFRLVDVVP